jgi:hypothetical protein
VETKASWIILETKAEERDWSVYCKAIAVSQLVQTEVIGLFVVSPKENHTSRSLSGHSNCEAAPGPGGRT